jgi:hypothetical protein
VIKKKIITSESDFEGDPASLIAIKKIQKAAKDGNLIIVFGAGISKGLTDGEMPAWKDLIDSGLGYAVTKGRMVEDQSIVWRKLLESSDIDDLLSSAEHMGRKLGAPSDIIYTRWLQDQFQDFEVSNKSLSSAITHISKQKIPFCTLNYDLLLENVTGFLPILVTDSIKATSWMRREMDGVLHLHGHFENPESCILGIRDYERTIGDDARDLLQRSLATFNQLLFIGCGDTFSDPNFSALISWMRKTLRGAPLVHYALTLESEVSVRRRDPAWSGFVEPLSYGNTHQELADFIIKLLPSGVKKVASKKRSSSTEINQFVINSYRSFLLRDCGQMTIEGVSADLDTGQRKFDLERLFVPLKIAGCPPELPLSDPERAQKLEEWHELNKETKAFGEVLVKNKRMALLALPGGGKTLLLKRLAVAYADPERRAASCDALPELTLIPVLIRCREWRDHIKLPIQTLLKKFGEITGQSDMAGLFDALIPYLKKGQVLLLIDGLDEIHNDADRAVFVDHLESFLEEYKNIRVVVTSREAGFNLVAPSISRFCSRWRIAPLEQEAIEMLCEHWHRLMSGDSSSSIEEGKAVASALVKNDSLHRLAENPLLLTMLLVVKHGAGGLPPDRVSLYSRAVEVLLDTWNIKGHEPLNPKEAVPQLAYVAFQLMCQGKQTATQKELLYLLDEAREKLPSIKRYAKDSPYQFLKRVELRSSLLLEAGHQVENGLTVPFYQFRHLTFQEYLSALAVVEGHYQEYRQDDTVLTPLRKYLLIDEWKEVVPMAAVLARKRAEPLILELINEASSEWKLKSESIDFDVSFGDKLSGPIGRLVQCFVEEVEASTDTLTSALSMIALFARGCVSSDNWQTICRGPYGEELYLQAWIRFKNLFTALPAKYESWIMNTCASFAVYRQPSSSWLGDEGKKHIFDLLQSGDEESLSRGLLICMGVIWASRHMEVDARMYEVIPISLVESHLYSALPTVFLPATWVRNIYCREVNAEETPSIEILDRFLLNFMSVEGGRFETTAYAIACQMGMPRDHWVPVLSEAASCKIVTHLEEFKIGDSQIIHLANLIIAYHAKSILSDHEILEKIELINQNQLRHILNWDEKYENMIIALGGATKKNKTARKVKP